MQASLGTASAFLSSHPHPYPHSFVRVGRKGTRRRRTVCIPSGRAKAGSPVSASASAFNALRRVRPYCWGRPPGACLNDESTALERLPTRTLALQPPLKRRRICIRQRAFCHARAGPRRGVSCQCTITAVPRSPRLGFCLWILPSITLLALRKVYTAFRWH